LRPLVEAAWMTRFVTSISLTWALTEAHNASITSDGTIIAMTDCWLQADSNWLSTLVHFPSCRLMWDSSVVPFVNQKGSCCVGVAMGWEFDVRSRRDDAPKRHLVGVGSEVTSRYDEMY